MFQIRKCLPERVLEGGNIVPYLNEASMDDKERGWTASNTFADREVGEAGQMLRVDLLTPASIHNPGEASPLESWPQCP